MIWWFLGLLGLSALVAYIGSRLPTRKVKHVQFGYDDPSVKYHARHTSEQLYQRK